MKINKVQSTNISDKGIVISCDSNKGVEFLYNKVKGIDKEFHIPVNYHTTLIELPTVTEEILQKLKQFGIAYIQIAKNEESQINKNISTVKFKPIIVNYNNTRI